jgi:hypothetical protein
VQKTTINGVPVQDTNQVSYSSPSGQVRSVYQDNLNQNDNVRSTNNQANAGNGQGNTQSTVQATNRVQAYSSANNQANNNDGVRTVYSVQSNNGSNNASSNVSSNASSNASNDNNNVVETVRVASTNDVPNYQNNNGFSGTVASSNTNVDNNLWDNIWANANTNVKTVQSNNPNVKYDVRPARAVRSYNVNSDGNVRGGHRVFISNTPQGNNVEVFNANTGSVASIRNRNKWTDDQFKNIMNSFW